MTIEHPDFQGGADLPLARDAHYSDDYIEASEQALRWMQMHHPDLAFKIAAALLAYKRVRKMSEWTWTVTLDVPRKWFSISAYTGEKRFDICSLSAQSFRWVQYHGDVWTLEFWDPAKRCHTCYLSNPNSRDPWEFEFAARFLEAAACRAWGRELTTGQEEILRATGEFRGERYFPRGPVVDSTEKWNPLRKEHPILDNPFRKQRSLVPDLLRGVS